MLAQINTCGLLGIDGAIVQVQTDMSNGMPGFDIIGLPDVSVKEAKERCKSAIKNAGFVFPAKKITTNLAPAGMKKEGAAYDLSIAVSVLCASQQWVIDNAETMMFLGELALDGTLRPVNGILPMVISGYAKGIHNFFVPAANADEAAVVEGARIYPVIDLRQLAGHFFEAEPIVPHKIDISQALCQQIQNIPDMSDVKGLENVKRAMEVAACGGHNMLMIGAPGTGKSMLAKRMAGILPDMSFDESLEVTKIHSIAGLLPERTPLIASRPFRSPHHTVSAAAVSGGGRLPRPGELSLAHNGILFLDELPEFRRDTLEVLRQPLEDGQITISRVNATLTYPCRIMLICSMNPCKCGYFGSTIRECTCTQAQVNQYRSRISGPLLDRIDIQAEVPSIHFDELASMERGESSKAIKQRVDAARAIQQERYKGLDIFSNAQLTPALIQEFCRLGEKENAILKRAFESLGLSARAHSRILKVARTIADMDEKNDINTIHIAEAIQYRSLDRKYFK